MRLNVFPYIPQPAGFPITWNIHSFPVTALIMKCRISWQSSHFFGLCVGGGGVLVLVCLFPFCSILCISNCGAFFFTFWSLLSSWYSTFSSYCSWTYAFSLMVQVKRLSSPATQFFPPVSVMYNLKEPLCYVFEYEKVTGKCEQTKR